MNLKRKRSDIECSFSRLCEPCEALLRTPESLRALLKIEPDGIKRNFGELTRSVKDGCSLCGLMLQSLEAVIAQIKPNRSIDITIRGVPSCINVGVASDYPFKKQLSGIRASILGACRNRAREGDWIACQTTKDSIAGSVLPVGGLPNHHYWERDEFYCEVQDQLDHCRDWHKSCPPIRAPILPTRVIDVGDENLPEQVKLHISAEGETASYIALSYCWGGDQRIKTTKDTLTSRIAGLELRFLPQTIQDAITITRGLKIRYLWIDVLCIIQDDEKDKRTEIENMGRIYKSASLTISAATAKTAEEGFLRVPEARIPIYSPSGEIAIALLTLPKEPIADRGWTFQEQKLSPWMLHFGNFRGVRFNCPTETYCYDGHKFNHTGTVDFHGTLPHTVFTQRKSRRSLGKNWAEIVTYYSKRRITNSEDRLPALAGIAKESHKICGGNYWAGMWEKFSIRHLGWRARITPSRALPKIKLEQIQRPTWSWVSLMDQQLEEPNHIRIEVDEVKEENAKVIKWPVLEDQKLDFGQATGGRLILQGKLATFLTPPRAVPNRMRWEVGEDWGMSIYYEIGDEITEAHYRYFLLGCTAWKSAVGLVLIPDKHDEDGAFLRIGQFRISAKAGEKYSWGVETREIIIV